MGFRRKLYHIKLIQVFYALQQQAARVGLKVNASKTKSMRIRSPANTEDITCGVEILKQVTAFTYLGSLVSITGSTEEDVKARCRKAQSAFCMLRPVWRSTCISLWTKPRIFNSNVEAVLLNGSETWRLTKRSYSSFRLSSQARSGTSWESGGQGGSQMRTCSSV